MTDSRAEGGGEVKNWDVDDWCQLIVVIAGAIILVRWLW